MYVYACNNPSESIIAKRRGYGTIVSHNVPPYGRAGGRRAREGRVGRGGGEGGGRAPQRTAVRPSRWAGRGEWCGVAAGRQMGMEGRVVRNGVGEQGGGGGRGYGAIVSHNVPSYGRAGGRGGSRGWCGAGGRSSWRAGTEGRVFWLDGGEEQGGGRRDGGESVLAGRRGGAGGRARGRGSEWVVRHCRATTGLPAASRARGGGGGGGEEDMGGG